MNKSLLFCSFFARNMLYYSYPKGFLLRGLFKTYNVNMGVIAPADGMQTSRLWRTKGARGGWEDTHLQVLQVY